MKHGHMLRTCAKAFFAFSTLALLNACADSPSVAPVAQAPAIVAPANFAQVGHSVVFRVDNAQGATKMIGAHLITIPANAICDLATSGYGAAFWNKPCQPLKGSIVITATIFNGNDGQPYIDFQPAMRFSPNKEVMLFLREGRTNGSKFASIKYCNAVGYCIDESLDDPTLRPFRVGRTSILGRRLKHFSGYVVAYETDCTGVATPIGDGNYWCEDGGFSRRSGYMVASGEDVKDVMDKGDDKSDQGKKDDGKQQQ